MVLNAAAWRWTRPHGSSSRHQSATTSRRSYANYTGWNFHCMRIDYKLAVLIYKCIRHTWLTNFIIQQSRSFEGVCVPLRLTNCLFPVPDSQPTATKHFQSPLYGSGTVFHRSHLLRHFPSSALAGRHTCSNSVTRNYCCRAREVTLSFMDTLIAFTIPLTYHQEQDVNEIDRPISKRWRRIDFSDVKIVHNAIILQWWRLWGYVAVRCVKLAIFGPLCYRGFKTVSNVLSVNKSNDDDITTGGV